MHHLFLFLLDAAFHKIIINFLLMFNYDSLVAKRWNVMVYLLLVNGHSFLLLELRIKMKIIYTPIIAFNDLFIVSINMLCCCHFQTVVDDIISLRTLPFQTKFINYPISVLGHIVTHLNKTVHCSLVT